MVEYIKAIVDTRWPAQMHLECFELSTIKKHSRWKTMVMNGFFKDARCARCNELLQCSCSKFKVSEARTGKCPHEKANLAPR